MSPGKGVPRVLHSAQASTLYLSGKHLAVSPGREYIFDPHTTSVGQAICHNHPRLSNVLIARTASMVGPFPLVARIPRSQCTLSESIDPLPG